VLKWYKVMSFKYSRSLCLVISSQNSTRSAR